MTAPDYNTFNKFLARPGPLVLRLTDKRHTLKKRKGDIIHIDTHTQTHFINSKETVAMRSAVKVYRFPRYVDRERKSVTLEPRCHRCHRLLVDKATMAARTSRV